MKKIGLFLFAAISVGTINAQNVTPPVMGWSSWNAFEVNINDSIICHHADLLVKKGLKDCGYKYVNIDDGFFGMRDVNGRMTGHATRFPNGLRNTVDYIHGLGLKAGIYTDAGTRTCGSFGNGEKTGMGAGIYGHERQDAQLYFNDWDFDFIKIDYCGGGHLLLDEQERYTDIYNAIKATAHKPISMNICKWAFPGTWAKDIAASWRISGDIRADWNSIKYIVGKNMYLSAFAGDGHFNDMDMLVIGLAKRGVGGKGLTPLEEETHFGLWCIMSSPLLIGADLNDIPEPSLNLLKNKELIALNQDPLGLQAYAVQHEGDSYVFVKDITTRRGLTRAVALYNESDTVHSFCVPLSELELGGKTSVRDLVHHKNLGTYKNEINFKVPAHNTMVLKLTAQERLEPIQYEAEWAYLPLYNDLGKSKGICTQQKNNASGRTIISYLGGKPDNYLEWKDVYSKDGGSYKLNISYYSSDLRSLEVTVNGQKQTLKNLGGKDGDERKQVSVNVNLKAGYNVIRLGNDFNWAPDIDCITVEKL